MTICFHNRVGRLIAQAMLSCAILPAFAETPAQSDIVALTAGMYVIQAEVASSPAQRAQGLMHREKMAPNNGMVFVFNQPAEVCMWMKNTPLPLSVAFIDDQSKVVNIEDMQPLSLESHCAKSQVRYALEMNLGWFKQKNIKPGFLIKGLPSAAK